MRNGITEDVVGIIVPQIFRPCLLKKAVGGKLEEDSDLWQLLFALKGEACTQRSGEGMKDITEILWLKASPLKGIINKNVPVRQSSSFQGEVILNSQFSILNS